MGDGSLRARSLREREQAVRAALRAEEARLTDRLTHCAPGLAAFRGQTIGQVATGAVSDTPVYDALARESRLPR